MCTEPTWHPGLSSLARGPFQAEPARTTLRSSRSEPSWGQWRFSQTLPRRDPVCCGSSRVSWCPHHGGSGTLCGREKEIWGRGRSYPRSPPPRRPRRGVWRAGASRDHTGAVWIWAGRGPGALTSPGMVSPVGRKNLARQGRPRRQGLWGACRTPPEAGPVPGCMPPAYPSASGQEVPRAWQSCASGHHLPGSGPRQGLGPEAHALHRSSWVAGGPSSAEPSRPEF